MTDPHYYDALRAKWPEAPPGTTDAKRIWVNKLTVTGTPPTAFSVTAADLYSSFDPGEWHQINKDGAALHELLPRVHEVLALPGLIPVGAGTTANIYIVQLFALSPATLAKLGALAVGQVQPWWQANAYPREFDMGDISDAGLS